MKRRVSRAAKLCVAILLLVGQHHFLVLPLVFAVIYRHQPNGVSRCLNRAKTVANAIRLIKSAPSHQPMKTIQLDLRSRRNVIHASMAIPNSPLAAGSGTEVT